MKTMKKLLFTATMAAWALAASAVTDILGDVNFDDYVDALDASLILAEYASQSTSQGTTFTDPQQKINADVDGNGVVDAIDASVTLAFYSFLSTGGSGRMEDWLASDAHTSPAVAPPVSSDGNVVDENAHPDDALYKPVLTVTVDGKEGGRTFLLSEARGRAIDCTVKVSGASAQYGATGLRVHYSDKLLLATNHLGRIAVEPGEAVEKLARSNPVEDPTAPAGMKGFFAATAGKANYGVDGTMWTFSFTLSDDVEPGDVLPIDIVFRASESGWDRFSRIEDDAAGRNMEAYLFTKGIYTAVHTNAFATGADVAACAALAGIAGDADGYIAIADPASVAYPLWVGGVQVCETNRTDILGDGTASFEGTATNGTLFLSNARITEAIEHPGISTANIWSDRGFDLTISLAGSNRVESAESTSDDYCVDAGANLAITGEGTLVVENTGHFGIGTRGSLRIDGATVTVSASDTGLSLGNTLAISNATVTATGTSSHGIYCSGTNGRIDIADSVVTATGGTKGLYPRGTGSSLAVSGASVVTAVTTSDDDVAFSAAALVLGDGLAVTEPAGGVFGEDGWGSGCVIDPATGGRARRVVIGPPRFAVTVEGGSTTNTTARAGETVTVVANAPEEGKAFVEWSADDAMDLSFATAAAATTTFAMPARAVTVTAVFKEIQIDSIPDQEWTGGPVEPEFRSDTVKFEGTDMVLLPGTDYTVSYTNNVDPGTATATVTMAPPRTGHASVTFQILPPPEPPAVSNVVARQRWPWNGLVDVDYEVGGDTNLLADLTVQITFTASDGRSWVATNFLAGAEPSVEPGAHRATWNTAADAGAGVMASNAIATVSLVRAPEPRWCVIDLSGGSAASSYPVTYVTDVPNVPGGFNADAYKTTNLVLRLVKPSDWADGTFTMGGSCEATLTNAFWIGVFETTQRQWELVAGGRPSYFRRDDGYATRPVEKVSYEMIRGSDAGSMWPDSGDVDEDSFLGKLRARTGLAFDLPTEAQWEFACRATTTTDYNNGSDWTDGTSCTNLDPLGRYWFNGGGGGNGNPDCDTSGGTAAVGSYQPNEWGLYDCHGNVDEWCLDWFGDFAASAVEPVGAPSGEKRVLRGGCWIDNAVNCRSTGRIGLTPDFVGTYYGFRLCLPAVAETAAAAAASAAFRLDTREGPFESDGTETLTYSTLWHPERVASNGTNATVTILQNGDEDEPVAAELAGEGDVVWQVFEDGTYVLVHKTVVETDGPAVSDDEPVETATFVVRGHPLVEAALRWKYAKNANGWHCAQVALTWHPSYADEISDMRLLFADRYEDSEPLAVIKVLDDEQAAFFEVPEMIKMAGNDWKYYFLNDENGKVYTERFLESGYREKLVERPTVINGDELGDVTGWASSRDSHSYITNGVLNADGTSFSEDITVNGRTVTIEFASSPRGLGRRTAYLVDPATVVDPLGTTETYRDVEYRVAPVDLTAFAGLADGARAVYGVSDETMDSSLDSVPRAERLICLRVVNRDYSTVGRVDNKLAILAWNVGGRPRFLPIAETMSSLRDGDDDPQPAPQPAPRPLSVEEANLSTAFGLAPAAVARGAVTCRVSSMSFGEDGSVEGTFAVAAENAGGVVAESGELAPGVKLTVLGATSLGGAFEPLDPSCGAELLSRKPPYAFRVKAPGSASFFKIHLEAEDVFE